jgi:hypothetical protein
MWGIGRASGWGREAVERVQGVQGGAFLEKDQRERGRLLQ